MHSMLKSTEQIPYSNSKLSLEFTTQGLCCYSPDVRYLCPHIENLMVSWYYFCPREITLQSVRSIIKCLNLILTLPCLNYLLTFLCNQNTIQILPHQMWKPAFGLCLFPTSILLPTLPSLYFSHGELFFCANHPGELYILYIFNIYLIKERENLNSPRLTHFFFFLYDMGLFVWYLFF